MSFIDSRIFDRPFVWADTSIHYLESQFKLWKITDSVAAREWLCERVDKIFWRHEESL